MAPGNYSSPRRRQGKVHQHPADRPYPNAQRAGLSSPRVRNDSQRRNYTASHARKTSRRVREHTVGTHVSRRHGSARRKSDIPDSIRRRAAIRRVLAGAIAVIVVVGLAVFAGYMAFHGTVGSSMALKNSNAAEALSPAPAEGPYYALIAAELGAVAEPLENSGPDAIILARVDNENKNLAFISIPPSLQVSKDSKTYALSSLADQGDAALIEGVESFTKLEISQFLKIDEQGIIDLVDTLGGVDVDIEQVIDDPQAGDVYLPMGPYTLKGSTALMYLRAENLKKGEQDKFAHQLGFAGLIAQNLLGEGGLATKMDSIDTTFQTSMALADFEAIGSWFQGKKVEDISLATMPGYKSSSGVADERTSRFVGDYDEFTQLLEDIERGDPISLDNTAGVETVKPSDFTLDVQNGTSISGAASMTADELKQKGFKVGDVGNADAQVYEETLVVYKDDKEGLARAKTVIEAMGIGRAVEYSSYYNFEGDVLFIIGSDYSPLT